MSEIEKILDECRLLRGELEHLKKERDRDRQILEQLRSERDEFRRLLYRPLWACISDEELRRWSQDSDESDCQTLDEFLPELKAIVQRTEHG